MSVKRKTTTKGNAISKGLRSVQKRSKKGVRASKNSKAIKDTSKTVKNPYFSKIGKIGGNKTLKRHGKEYFKNIQDRRWSLKREERLEIIRMALGEVSALFMSSKKRGRDIVMPTEKLIKISEKTVDLLFKK